MKMKRIYGIFAEKIVKQKDLPDQEGGHA